MAIRDLRFSRTLCLVAASLAGFGARAQVERSGGSESQRIIAQYQQVADVVAKPLSLTLPGTRFMDSITSLPAILLPGCPVGTTANGEGRPVELINSAPWLPVFTDKVCPLAE
jgi:hypothetical protein